MTRTGSWSMRLALMLAVAALVWAGAASIAATALEDRLHGGPSGQASPRQVLTAR